MVDTLDLKSRLAKLRLAGVQQDQHVKKKIKDDNEWEDIKKESYEEPQPAYPEEIEAAEEKRKSIYGKKLTIEERKKRMKNQGYSSAADFEKYGDYLPDTD